MQSEEQLSPFDVPLENVVLPPELCTAVQDNIGKLCSMKYEAVKRLAYRVGSLDADLREDEPTGEGKEGEDQNQWHK